MLTRYLLMYLLFSILVGCSSTSKNNGNKNQKNTNESLQKTHPSFHVDWAKFNLESLRKDSTSNNLSYSYGSKIEVLCLNKGDVHAGVYDYISDRFKTSRNPSICIDRIAEYISENIEQQEYLTAIFAKRMVRSIEFYTKIKDKSFDNKYSPFVEELKQKSKKLEILKIVHLKKNNPTIWFYNINNDDFDERTTHKAVLKTKKGYLSYHDDLAIECRINSAGNKDLSISWKLDKVFSTPNTAVEFIAIIDGSPKKLKSYLFSNSYTSGYIPFKENNENFNLLIKYLEQGHELKYRLRSRNNRDIKDSKQAEADETSGLMKVVNACS